MIAELKPYGEYKESGQGWIGHVPRHWKSMPFCRVTSLSDQRGRPDLELLSVYLNRGVIRYSESSGQVHKPSLDLCHYQVVHPGNFVLNNQQAWRGSVGVSKYLGIVSPAYVVLQLSRELNSSFSNYLFRSPAMVAQFVAASRGVGDIQRNLYWPDLRRAIVIIPPPDEQAAIVRFLDHANQKIDRFIRAKRKLIALLNEQKQAIIHRAVTRGLNPNAPLKRSGIPWLGDIPEQWDVRRNGRLFKERIENGKTGLPVLIVSLRTGVTIGSGTNEAGRERRLIADATAYKLACQNDIAYNMMRMWQGAVGVVPELGLVSPAYVVAKPLEGVCSSYYELLFRTDACKGEINRNSRGIVSDRNRLYWEDFKQLTSPVPPYDEQIKIVESLSNQFIEVDQVIARTEREIALMQEYRTRLTAEVVTGKLDVREAAAKLPDTTDSTNDTDSYNSDTDEEEFDADTSEE